MTFSLDQPVTLTFRTYSDSARTTLADATTAVLYVKAPDGTVSTPTVTHSTTGIYTYLAPDTTAGLYQYRWKATGTVATSSRAGAFSVDAAFPAMLVGLEDVQTHLKETGSDDQLTGFIYAATAALVGLPDYRIADVAQVQTYTEDWTEGGDTIQLDHYPVASVTSVTEYAGGVGTALAAEAIDAASFTSNGYRLDARAGLIRRLSGGCVSLLRGNVRTVYTVGSGSVPQEVRLACLDLIKFWWQQTQAAGTQTYGEQELGIVAPFGIPNAVTDKLAAFRRGPVFG